MALDMFFSHADMATLVQWLTSPQVKAQIGDLTWSEGATVDPLKLRGIPGNVDVKQWEANTLALRPIPPPEDPPVPVVLDTNAWVQIRLSGQAELDDRTGNRPDDVDRWDYSKMVNLSSAGSDEQQDRSVTVWEKRGGQYKDMKLYRGSEMAAAGLKFHEFLGGQGD